MTVSSPTGRGGGEADAEGPRHAGRLIWITRAEPGAHDTAAALRALAAEPLIAPLIETRPLAGAPPFPIADAAALAFTSAAGVRAFSSRGHPLADTPVFAVGAATARAAREAGAREVHDADGDVAALARLIAAARAHGAIAGPVLHPGAAGLAAPLAGATPWPVYETTPTAAHHAAIRAALAANRIRAVLLHSPSAARALAAFAAPADLAGVAIHALSSACAAPLPPTLAARSVIAPHPREGDLLRAVVALANRPAPATRERLPSEPP